MIELLAVLLAGVLRLTLDPLYAASVSKAPGERLVVAAKSQIRENNSAADGTANATLPILRTRPATWS
jgi:hypothetical protein